MADTLRESAEGIPEILERAANWIEALPLENSIPHAEMLRARAVAVQKVLDEPDPSAAKDKCIDEHCLAAAEFLSVSTGVFCDVDRVAEILKTALGDAFEELERDAERYRWLRADGLKYIRFDGLTVDTCDVGLDFAIDAAMKER